MTDLDNEFERFKSNLDAEITAWLKLPDTKSKSRSKHIAKLQKLRQQLLQDPRLRESFVRGVFANDQSPKYPGTIAQTLIHRVGIIRVAG